MDASVETRYQNARISLRNKMGRVLWQLTCALLFRHSPRTFHAWRAIVLRCFGAKLGRRCHIYPRSSIWAPWNLKCDDGAAIADDAVIYNVAEVRIGVHAVVSQQAYLCTATHDFDDPAFPMITAPITVARHAWICARASVLPGVTVQEGAVLGLGSVASKDLEAWQVYAGLPAKRIRGRQRHVRAI